MFLSKEIDNFLGNITKQQLDVVKDFFSTPVNWDEVKHGDKKKLEENISVVFFSRQRK